jgi:succinate-semialdehyde dehydrogenase/glutarate-semialdehyde dehydrogenase
VIVEAAVADRFTEQLLRHVDELRVGDPTDPQVTIGPLARADLRDALAAQVHDSVALGAEVLAGGDVVDRAGFFFEPTVLGNVSHEMPVLREEVFGPVLPIVIVPDADAALRAANDTEFGLGSDLFTADLARGRRIALALDAGHTAINWITTSDARLPFGGVKASGYGRELSTYGLHEFVNVHALVIEPPSGPSGHETTLG